MKFRNTITGYVFDVDVTEGKKLFSDFECFELVEADKDEKAHLENVEKKNMSIRQRVMKNFRFAKDPKTS